MNTLITFSFLFFSFVFCAAQNNSGVEGKISTEQFGNSLKIKAVGTNSSDLYQELDYMLIALKKGKSGMSSNKQSGKFTLNPHETKTLSEISINLTKKDGLKVFLFLKNEQSKTVVSKDSIEINGNQFADAAEFIPENEVELPGLTIDETKTRLGQLFYESFFKQYNQNPTKIEGTVVISELPTTGRTTQITVTIDNQIIHSFMSRPDEEAMDAEASRALANLMTYNARNNLRNKEFKY